MARQAKPSRAQIQEEQVPKQRQDSQATVQEESDPKQLAYHESNSEQNAPIFTDNSVWGDRRPSNPQRKSLTEFDSTEPPAQSTKLDTTKESYAISKTGHIKTWCILILIILVLALVLGLALGLTLGKHHHKSVVQSGALNGSGIIALDLGDGSPRITTYTQRFDGVIVKSEYLQGHWSGGNDTGAINTTDTSSAGGITLKAKEGTPLMALSYTQTEELIWHVYYVTEDNYLSNWVNSNITDSWTPGNLRGGNFQVSSSPHVGLSACVNTAWYGAPYNESGLGIRLYYGASDDSIHELSWNLDGESVFFETWNFADSNGAGGVECTVRGQSITYVWMENLAGEMQMMWFDFNSTTNTTSHPARTWVKGLTASPILHNSAISAINQGTLRNVHFQTPNLTIVEFIANGSGEQAVWIANYTVGSTQGINGTRIGSVVLNTTVNDGLEIHVMFQSNSSNMLDYTRALDTYDWSQGEVPISA